MENQISVGDQNTQQIGQNPVNQPVLTPEQPKTSYLMTGGIILVSFVFFGLGGYYVGKISSVKNSVSDSKLIQIATLTGLLDSMTKWTAYNINPDSSLGYASYEIKVPAFWKQIEHSSKFQDTETFQDDVISNVYKLIVHQEKNYNNQTGKPYTALKEVLGQPYDVTTLIVDKQQAARVLPRAGSESDFKVIFFSENNKLIFSIELDTPRDGSKVKQGEALFNQILSTFNFIDKSVSATIAPTKIPQTSGADLKEIKYTLLQGWTAKLHESSLLISPVSGGGYLSIRVYNYPGTVGRREYYCQLSRVCIQGTTYFTEMSVGNISGYVANALDNSGGGPEYFGAKDNRFYIISSYNPPSPNEFEKNYKNVLDSLLF